MHHITRVCHSFLAAVLSVAVSGCATIASGGEQKVGIRSDPSDAAIQVLDSSGSIVFQSRTPATAILKKGQGYFQAVNYRVVIEKPGYKKQEVLLTSSLNAGWYILGNFILGGFIGWLIVDPITGAMWTLSPESVSAQMVKESAFLRQTDGLMIMLLEDVPDRILPVMERVAVPEV